MFTSSSGGLDDNYTGSPNASGSCGNCHSGGTNTGGALSLSGISGSFVAGQTYTITLKLTLPNLSSAVRAGFQIEAVDANNLNYGTLIAGGDSRESQNATGLLTQDSPKNFSIVGANKEVSWTFEWEAPTTGASSPVKFYYVINATNGDFGTSGDNSYSGSTTISAPAAVQTVAISAKVLLSNADPSTGTMTPALAVSSNNNFPLTDPYSVPNAYNGAFSHVNNQSVDTTTSSVLSVTGNNAIIDWVFMELRTGSFNSTTVTHTKSVLLQSDGDLVATDGISPVSFTAPFGNYYIAIKHRNHLGFRTSNSIALSSTPSILNFTNNAIPLYGTTPVVSISSQLNSMVGGDANSDQSIDAFDSIDWEVQNGLFDDYTLNADYNLDGSVDAFDSIVWEFNNGKFEEIN